MDPTESEKEVVPGTVANSGPPEATEKTAASLPRSVDPIAVGGAVGGMTVGEAIGGAIGGVIGAVAGPGGAAIGAGLGAFAGTSIGTKLGYDVTHELVHPEDVDPNASLKERRRRLPGAPPGEPETPSAAASVPPGAHWSGPSWPVRWAARSAHSSARPSPASWERNALPISMPKSSIGQRTLISLRQHLKPRPNPTTQIPRSGSRTSPARQRARQAWQPHSAPLGACLPAIRGERWAGGQEPWWRSISTGRFPLPGNAGIPPRRERSRKRPRVCPNLEAQIAGGIEVCAPSKASRGQVRYTVFTGLLVSVLFSTKKELT